MSLTIKSLDHLVLTVRSLSRTTEFYTRHLGMRHSVFTSKGTERHALLFGNQKINLHLAGHEFDPCAERPVPGSADLCFVTDVKVGEVAEMWKKEGIEVDSLRHLPWKKEC